MSKQCWPWLHDWRIISAVDMVRKIHYSNPRTGERIKDATTTEGYTSVVKQCSKCLALRHQELRNHHANNITTKGLK